MKAVLCTRYGPPEALQLREVPRPTPRRDDVLVRVHATTVSSGDCRARSFDVPPAVWLQARLILGITRPRRPIQGLWLAGEIHSVGSKVKSFGPGDRVWARTPDLRLGAYAEYACLPADGVVTLMPSNASYAEAVAIPFGALAALHFLREARVRRGQRVLIHGASGAVGTAAIQLARYFGAEVTGVCSTVNLPLVHSLGAQATIDYLREDFRNRAGEFDVVFDAAGKTSKVDSKVALKEGGRFVSVVSSGHANVRVKELLFIKSLVERKVLEAVIDRSYPLHDIVEAHRYVDRGHKRGNVVITVSV